MNADICKLCEKEAELKESHIVPKLIFRWLKQTSATGLLRKGTEINKPIQDGLKLQWLCFDCEQRFSRWESYFAKSIFHTLRKKDRANYNQNLLKFLVSLSWRVLAYSIELRAIDSFSPEIVTASNRAIVTWKNFLFDNIRHPCRYEQHLYNFFGEIESPNMVMSSNINRYLQRAVEIDVISNGEVAFVYNKLPGLLSIGYINLSSSREWRKTRICVNQGQIMPMNYNFPAELWNIIQQKADNAQKLKNSISPAQQEKINKRILGNVDKSVQSETFKALESDIKLFGTDLAFSKN
ncbi:TPA: hypothetical protein ACT9IY_002886 [Legionella pneumophila]|nr:hypothetical protein [Legionella pneumophila]HCZ0415265.1 hypothetical protein [Legionella pneumophila]HDE5451009.1 hypothetical protein [Legionella pneumophila]